MRLHTVAEARDEYYAFELAAASRRLAEDVLEVRTGQSVVLTADTLTDMRVVQSAAAAIYAAGAFPVVLHYHTLPRPQMEPPPVVAAAILAADIWIEFAVSYTVYTQAWQAAVDKGVQYCGLNGMDADGMVRCIGRQDVRTLSRMGETIERLLTGAAIRVTSAAGTDISFRNEAKDLAAFRMRANPGKIPIMLAGQVSWSPIEASMSGVLVADGILCPPYEVGILQQPVTFEVEAGRIVKISGGRDAVLLQNWLKERDDPNLNRIAHVSMGFNPGIGAPTGRILEDERAFGDIDFGFGAWVGRPAKGHFDFTCRQVSIHANGRALQENGVFVEPELAAFCRAMNVPRH